jgi:Tfp pilus assembly protein PilX
MQTAGAHRTNTSTQVASKKAPENKHSDAALFDVLFIILLVVLLPFAAWRKAQRRARMTPQERIADDQLQEARRLRRAVERLNRFPN